MINIYDELRSQNGDLISRRTKLFIKSTNEDDNLDEYMSGVACVPEMNGTMFIVDDWLIDQLDKVVFQDGALQVKEGEKLDEPVKSEKEKQREELLRQLALLDADTEEQTDAPLLDYTEKPSE